MGTTTSNVRSATVGVDTLLVIAVAIVMVVGLAGTLLPILPGLWLIWAAALVFGLVAGDGVTAWVAVGAITMVAIAGTVAGWYVPQRGAAAIGVSWWGQAAAAVLAAVGFFAIPVVGAPLGFLAGLVGSDLARTRDITTSWRTSVAVMRAMLLASVVQTAAGVAMIALWVVWVVVA